MPTQNNTLPISSKDQVVPNPVVQPIQQTTLPLSNTKPAPVQTQGQSNNFNVSEAMKYNTKSSKILNQFKDKINNILHNTDEWNTENFANTIYNWQKSNGIGGHQLDGKLGPVTMNQMAQKDAELNKTYKPYFFYMNAKPVEMPNKQVLSLKKQLNDISISTGIPLAMLIGWIQVESGGNNGNNTMSAGFREAGLFQISQTEADRLKINLDKVVNDLEYSLRSGARLIKAHARDVDKSLALLTNISSGIQRGSDFYWRLVMFTFSAGEGTTLEVLTLMNKYKFVPKTWMDLIMFISSHPNELRKKFFATKWAAHVDRAFNIGYMAVNELNKTVDKAAQLFIIKKRARRANIKIRKIILNSFGNNV